MMIHCNSKKASVRPRHFLCFNGGRIWGGDLVAVECI